MRWIAVAALVVSVGVGLADELPEDTNEIATATPEVPAQAPPGQAWLTPEQRAVLSSAQYWADALDSAEYAKCYAEAGYDILRSINQFGFVTGMQMSFSKKMGEPSGRQLDNAMPWPRNGRFDVAVTYMVMYSKAGRTFQHLYLSDEGGERGWRVQGIINSPGRRKSPAELRALWAPGVWNF